VLEEYDRAREAEDENEAEEGSAYSAVFECVTEDVDFVDPGEAPEAGTEDDADEGTEGDTGGGTPEVTVRRRSPNGDVRVTTNDLGYGAREPAACLAEQEALVECTAGR
jgi:hypothetical protein